MELTAPACRRNHADMKPLLRWLAFFVIGDVLMGMLLAVLWIATVAVVLPIKHAIYAFSWAGWNLTLAWRVFLVQDWGAFDTTVAGVPVAVVSGMAVWMIILGPIAGWILARNSLDNEGWRFWRWHGSW